MLEEHAVFSLCYVQQLTPLRALPSGLSRHLAKAAFVLDEDSFGRATGKVMHSCIALWQDISAAEARVYGSSCARASGKARRPPHGGDLAGGIGQRVRDR